MKSSGARVSVRLLAYTRAGWRWAGEPGRFVGNWHIECMCEHLEAVAESANPPAVGQCAAGPHLLDRLPEAKRAVGDRKLRPDRQPAIESQRRPPARHSHRPPRRLRRRDQLPHRAGRALFPRYARALVGGVAGSPRCHSAPALQERSLIEYWTASPVPGHAPQHGRSRSRRRTRSRAVR
jgi:hypothetical protein